MFCKEANALIHPSPSKKRKVLFEKREQASFIHQSGEKNICHPYHPFNYPTAFGILSLFGDSLPFPATLRCRLCWRPMDNKRRVLLAFPSRVNRQVMIIMGVICSRNSDLYIPQGKQQGGLFFIQQKRQIKEPFFFVLLSFGEIRTRKN